MKHIINHCSVPFMAIVALLAGSVCHAVPVVSLNPSNATFLAGSSVFVDVLISGVPAGDDVAAYDLDVTYDGALLSQVDIAFDSFLGNAALFEVLESKTGVNTAPGVVDFAALSLLSDADLLVLQSPQNGAFRLATLKFQALRDGQSDFALVYGPGNDVKCANNQVCVPSVPEPAVSWLFGLGLTLLLFQAKARAKAV